MQMIDVIQKTGPHKVQCLISIHFGLPTFPHWAQFIVPLMHEKLQGLREQGELIKKENEGKKKLELAYISNDNFFGG